MSQIPGLYDIVSLPDEFQIYQNPPSPSSNFYPYFTDTNLVTLSEESEEVLNVFFSTLPSVHVSTDPLYITKSRDNQILFGGVFGYRILFVK